MIRRTETRTLHFDLSFLADDCEAQLHVGTKRHPLQAHTAETLAAHRQTNAALAVLPDDKVTHFVEEVVLPSDFAQLLRVTTPSKVEGAQLPTLLLTFLHTPEESRCKHIARLRTSRAATYDQPHPKLKMYGVSATAKNDESVIIDVHDFATAMDAAVSIVFHHAELMNIGADTSATVRHTIEFSNGISDLAEQILTQAQEHQKDPSKANWVIEEPYVDTNFKPTSSMRYTWTDTTKEWMPGPMKDSLRKTKNDPSLRSTSTNAGLYTIQDGKTAVHGEQPAEGRLEAATEDQSSYWTLTALTPKHGYENRGGVTLENGEFKTQFYNSWLRWLSIYAEFLGPNGEPVTPENWKSPLTAGLAKAYDSDTKKYINIVSSTNTILAIPVGNTPTDANFTWPKNATSVRLLSGGIGRTGGIEGQDGQYHGSWDSKVCTPGAIMTGFFNFGIPTVCLLAGAGVSLSGLNSIAKSAFSIILDVATALVTGPASSAFQGGNILTVLTAFADMIPHLLLDITDLAVWMSAEIAEGAAEEATPIFGWIALAVSVIADIALLTETSVEVALSPATFEYRATRALDAQWTLLPDKDHQNTWPLEADHYVITATFRDGTTRTSTGKMTSSPQTGPIQVVFDQAADNRLPWGGEVMFSAHFYSKDNWLAGQVSTDYLSAAVENNQLVVPEMHITENLIPISKNTVYDFNNRLIYDEAGAKLEWSKSVGPSTATMHDLSSSTVGQNLASLESITLSQRTSQLGYAWQASGQGVPECGQTDPDSGQLFTFQAIDVREPQSSLRQSPCGLTTKPMLAFDLQGPADGDGMNFFLDPRNSGYHLRQQILDGKPGEFDMQQKTSWGRFNEQIDACVVHPSGYVAGINTSNAKLEILKVPSAAVENAKAPLANIYSGYGSRPGLLHLPVAVAALPGAGIAVLEQQDPSLGNAPARVQAFDFFGNPAPLFANGSPFFEVAAVDEDSIVLDLAVESKGYVYVLKALNQGKTVGDYWLNIYKPDGTPLAQSPKMPAGKLAVDLWRTVYTLDYGKVLKPSGLRTEPSVSQWLPSTP